jgi:hypothetical protein
MSSDSSPHRRAGASSAIGTTLEIPTYRTQGHGRSAGGLPTEGVEVMQPLGLLTARMVGTNEAL